MVSCFPFLAFLSIFLSFFLSFFLRIRMCVPLSCHGSNGFANRLRRVCVRGVCSGHDQTQEAPVRHRRQRDRGQGQPVSEALDGTPGGRGRFEVSGRSGPAGGVSEVGGSAVGGGEFLPLLPVLLLLLLLRFVGWLMDGWMRAWRDMICRCAMGEVGVQAPGIRFRREHWLSCLPGQLS